MNREESFENDIERLYDRVYLPPMQRNTDIKVKEYLNGYIQREFPFAPEQSKIYSVPKRFRRVGEQQANLAEEVAFNRLHGVVANVKVRGVWMLFIHNVSYAGHSYRNHRVGKLMVREHDFVVFIKHNGKNHVALIEVKSTHDNNTNIPDVSITSDAKVIKNNKRSAQHQLRDHCEIIQMILSSTDAKTIQKYIFWPFLSALTKDPKQVVIKRWREDDNLHVFEHTLSEQKLFDEWFGENVINGVSIDEQHFITLLNRYLILSCGVFVDELRKGMLALLTQEQLQLFNSEICQKDSIPAVVHAAAGTGKTLLIIRKLRNLHEIGKLDENNRALYVCYWPGIRSEVESKLKILGLDKCVDTARFYISQTGFLLRNKVRKYKHIFVDESEVLCLAFDEIILKHLLSTIYTRYHEGNCTESDCPLTYLSDMSLHKTTETWGELWFFVDVNQASFFIPKHSPEFLKIPQLLLSSVMRTTNYIYKLFKQFYTKPSQCKLMIPDIDIGHPINGPPICWVNSDIHKNALINVIIDLCATKGLQPNDLCILPFVAYEIYKPINLNKEIDRHFVENGYRPKCVTDVEKFVEVKEVNEFLVTWGLRVKGLEFKVVIVVIDDGDFDVADCEDRKKFYIMTSRSTCMLIVISSLLYKNQIDVSDIMQEYCFGLNLTKN